MTEHDPILAAIQAARYAESIMARTAADFPPESPHDDWKPINGDPEYADWHPPVGSGETHAKYRVYPDRSKGYTSRWSVQHSGRYQGMKTVNFPPSVYRDYESSTMPSYSKDKDPSDMLGTFHSLEDAKDAAHQHFQQTYGGGSGMGDVDLNQLSDQGDAKAPRHRDLPDFGRSDGGGFYLGIHQRLAAAAWRQRIAAELSPPCPDCGQVAGFDEHMVSPRIRVCRNCEYPMTDIGHDHLLDRTLSGHDQAIADLPETDHPTLGKHGQLSYEDTMKLIDDQLAEGEPMDSHKKSLSDLLFVRRNLNLTDLNNPPTH